MELSDYFVFILKESQKYFFGIFFFVIFINMKLLELIKETVYEVLNEQIGEIDYNYEFDKSKLNDFVKNARKWNEEDFINEYVYLNDIDLIKNYGKINKGDEVFIVRKVTDNNGKYVYKNSVQLYAPYKKVISDKDYGEDYWKFIMDNTKELQDEAKILYNKNKKNRKEKLKENEKIIKGYHASPNKFKYFRYGQNKTSGQTGANNGFFFFKDIKFANYYGSIIKEKIGNAYIYDCDIKIGNNITEKGENIGTNWNRADWLEQARDDGYDTAIIKNADTGYGITDEIVVFDDDNIIINKIIKL